MTYDAFKVVHLFGVVLFLGNIIVTAVWKVMADHTGDPRIIAYAQRLVTLTDWIFTAGGVVLILVGAYGMAAVAGRDEQCAYVETLGGKHLCDTLQPDGGSRPFAHPSHGAGWPCLANRLAASVNA